MPLPDRSPGARIVVALALAATVVLGACGGDDADDPAADGARSQATERLVAYGLDEDEATCLVDELGAEVINESGEISALADGEPYQSAAEECLDG